MKSGLFMLIFTCIVILETNAQDVYYPKMGEKIKDHEFTELVNYDKKSMKISDYEGQWLVIDFWSRYCGSCIASFPKINKLDQQFKGRVKVMMVGMYESRTRGVIDEKAYIKRLFSERVKRQNLQFTNAFDSTVLEKYNIAGIPAIFVINPDGILVAKTAELDSATLEGVMAGKSPEYRRNYSANEPRPTSNLTYKLPIPTIGQTRDGGIDTLFIGSSILARWQKGMPEFALSGLHGEGLLSAIGFDLRELYRIAYTGAPGWGLGDPQYSKISQDVILELKDTSLFQINNGRRNSSNTYVYQRNYPKKKNSESTLRNQLLTDLNSFLGVTATLQYRDVDALYLVITDKKLAERLRSLGKPRKTSVLPDRPGGELVNITFSEFLQFSQINSAVYNKYPIDGKQPVVMDSTGIDYNIDMIFDGDPTDWQQALEVLNKHGLDLVKGKVKMQCIVIRDADSPITQVKEF